MCFLSLNLFQEQNLIKSFENKTWLLDERENTQLV